MSIAAFTATSPSRNDLLAVAEQHGAPRQGR
jgi:hypothetical protein